VIDAHTLGEIEARLASDDEDATLDLAFDRFERTQPHLAERVSVVLARPLDETALALGYFLSISLWLAFERRFGVRLRTALTEEVEAVEAALRLEEELRAERAHDPASVEDVVAKEQPTSTPRWTCRRESRRTWRTSISSTAPRSSCCSRCLTP